MKNTREAGIDFFDDTEAFDKNNDDGGIIMGEALKKLKEKDLNL